MMEEVLSGYQGIRKSEELRVWNWLNVGCIGPNLKVKCVGRFNGVFLTGIVDLGKLLWVNIKMN